MTLISWLAVVSAIITILAFLFAVWVWLESRTKIRELEGIVQSAYEITGNILWNRQIIRSEDTVTRIGNIENSLGQVSGLHVMTRNYAREATSSRGREIGVLVERGVIWTSSMITELERSERTQEIWLHTPDLEPDLSAEETGRMVSDNLKARKRYVYFCPEDMIDFEDRKRRLLANIGATRSREASRVTVVPIRETAHRRLSQRGNTLIFFAGGSEWGPYSAFEEVVFTKITERGLYWQEHKSTMAAEIRGVLGQELHNWNNKPST